MKPDTLKWSRTNEKGEVHSKCGRFYIEREPDGSKVCYSAYVTDPSLSASTPELLACNWTLRWTKRLTQLWLNDRLEEIREETRRKAAETEAQWRDKNGIPNWDFPVE